MSMTGALLCCQEVLYSRAMDVWSIDNPSLVGVVPSTWRHISLQNPLSVSHQLIFVFCCLITTLLGELRWITRLSRTAFNNGITAADVEDGTAIEGSDVFEVDGQTRSKFYSSVRFVEDQVHGVKGAAGGAYIVCLLTLISSPLSHYECIGRPWNWI